MTISRHHISVKTEEKPVHVVLQRNSRSPRPACPAVIEPADQSGKTYDTVVSVYQMMNQMEYEADKVQGVPPLSPPPSSFLRVSATVA